MRLKSRFVGVLGGFALVAGGVVGITSPAQAAAASPADLYYPAGASCNTGAPAQKWVDSGNAQVNTLLANSCDTVTIRNSCTLATIYVNYGQGMPYDAVAPNATAVITIGSSAPTVQAYSSANAFSLWASVNISNPPDVTATGTNASTTLSVSSVSTAVNSMMRIQNNASNSLLIYGVTGSVQWGGQTCTQGSPCNASAGQPIGLTVVSQGTIRVGSATLTIGSGGGGGGSSSSSSVATGPAPVFQQFGKPATGTCADAAAATLNWAGVASGGWGESWAQWMNGGKGGAVCNRALIYSLGLSKWVVSA